MAWVSAALPRSLGANASLPAPMSAPTTATTPTAIERRFAALRQAGRCALMPFLMAGDADLSITRATLLALQAEGADLIELGIPYSDPLADGPVIQAAASRALAAGTTRPAAPAAAASRQNASMPRLSRGLL